MLKNASISLTFPLTTLKRSPMRVGCGERSVYRDSSAPGWRARSSSRDAEALHLLVEALARHAEVSGGLGAAAAVGGEGLADQPGLDAVEGFAQAVAGAQARLDRGEHGAQPVREVLGSERLAGLGEGQRALDLVLELADVARPGVRLEQVLLGSCGLRAQTGRESAIQLARFRRSSETFSASRILSSD